MMKRLAPAATLCALAGCAVPMQTVDGVPRGLRFPAGQRRIRELRDDGAASAYAADLRRRGRWPGAGGSKRLYVGILEHCLPEIRGVRPEFRLRLIGVSDPRQIRQYQHLVHGKRETAVAGDHPNIGVIDAS